jgi:hypothetical protein
MSVDLGEVVAQFPINLSLINFISKIDIIPNISANQPVFCIIAGAITAI